MGRICNSVSDERKKKGILYFVRLGPYWMIIWKEKGFDMYTCQVVLLKLHITLLSIKPEYLCFPNSGILYEKNKYNTVISWRVQPMWQHDMTKNFITSYFRQNENYGTWKVKETSLYSWDTYLTSHLRN